MDTDDSVSIRVDKKIVQDMAAVNGLKLSNERAADLVPAVQAILDADAQLAALKLDGLPAVGLPWDTWYAKGTE